MRAKTINEGGSFKSKKHMMLGRILMRAPEDKFEDIVYDIWPDITGNIFTTDITKIVNRVPDEEVDKYLTQLNEWGGAGFSMGSSIFPVNRGGQSNRGGFGGANNLGGPNMMYTYEIKPLTRNLQPDPTNFETEEPIHNGHYIEGQELNKRDKKVHRGTVLTTERTDEGDVMYFEILCNATKMKMKIDPTTAVLLGGDIWVEDQKGGISKDAPDRLRAGQMQENKNNSTRAKTVNEFLNKRRS
jgi:hypothetical protein